MAFNYKTEYDRYRRYYQSLEPVIKKSATRTYTTAIFSFLAVSLFGWYGIRPTIQTILFLRREIADNQVVNKRMEDKITHLIEAQAAYQNVYTQLPVLDESLPESPEILYVVNQLKNLARATNSSLSALQVPQVPILPAVSTPSSQPAGLPAQTGPGSLVEVPLVAVVNGSYTSIKSFIDGVIGMRRILSIGTINIGESREETGRSSTASGSLLQLVVKLTVYYLPPSGKK